MTRARALLTVGESDRVAFLLEQALAQWRGPAFADLPDWPPGPPRGRTARRAAPRGAGDARGRACCAAGGHARCWRWRTRWCGPPRCGSVAGSFSSSRSTRPAPRARRCARCASSAAVLARELGIDPSPEMLALEQSILSQDPRLLVPQQRRRGGTQCPWQGLMAYDVDDTERFFGRDADVDACLAILAPGLVRRPGGAVRLGQVLPPARRRAGGPAPPRPPGRPRHAGATPDAVAHRAAGGRAARHGPRRGPGRGGVRPVRRPGGEADLPRAAGRGGATAAGARHGAGRPARAGDRARGLQPVGGERPAPRRRPRRGRPAPGDRAPRRAGGPGHRARPGRRPRARGARRPRRPAPALARPARDLAAARGQHPDRRRLPRLRRHPRRRRPVRRAALRTDRARAASAAARPGAAAGLARRRGRGGQDAACRDGSSRPPTTSSSRPWSPLDW